MRRCHPNNPEEAVRYWDPRPAKVGLRFRTENEGADYSQHHWVTGCPTLKEKKNGENWGNRDPEKYRILIKLSVLIIECFSYRYVVLKNNFHRSLNKLRMLQSVQVFDMLISK